MSVSTGGSPLTREGNARSNRARVTIKSTTYGVRPTCGFSLFIRRILCCLEAVRIRRITRLLATRSDDVGRQRGAVRQSGLPKTVGARWADPWANLSGECELGLRCK